jgi:hypothetical protein
MLAFIQNLLPKTAAENDATVREDAATSLACYMNQVYGVNGNNGVEEIWWLGCLKRGALADRVYADELAKLNPQAAERVSNHPTGILAKQWCNKVLPLEILQTRAGFYIGTTDAGMPCSRESSVYWPTAEAAYAALASGEWPQKQEP